MQWGSGRGMCGWKALVPDLWAAYRVTQGFECEG
jgi:hypothetical protein